LGDIKHAYTKSDTLQKREFVNMVFDGNLLPRGYISNTYNFRYVFLIMPVKWRKRDVLYKKRGKPFGNPSQWDEGFEPRPLKRGVEPAELTPKQFVTFVSVIKKCANIRHFSRFASKKQKIIIFLRQQNVLRI
jgi:hypothetical protein